MEESRQDYYRKIYLSRINKVIDYISEHLAEQMSLIELADVAHFSRFHFHRIFSSIVGETLSNYIKRQRLERAASWLKGYSDQTINDVAVMSGFNSQAAFARAFREHFGMSPTEFRNGGYMQLSKDRKTKSKKGKTDVASTGYFSREFITIKKRRLSMNVEIKEMPEMHVAYCRHKGSYSKIGIAIEKLMRWAGPQGLTGLPETKMLAVYHDDPDITPESKLRSSACITVAEDIRVDGEIGKMKLEGGVFAVAHFEITEDQYGNAWDMVMRDWLPGSGYQCDDRPHYELYHNDPEEHPERKHIVDICIPVKPL